MGVISKDIGGVSDGRDGCVRHDDGAIAEDSRAGVHGHDNGVVKKKDDGGSLHFFREKRRRRNESEGFLVELGVETYLKNKQNLIMGEAIYVPYYIQNKQTKIN